ncbi:MAG TPA: zinc-ribbon domain-containing protein [Actinoplanes sp.]|nr:zinc-ribbon domain-containing protein [Actinoplanes sp.]
MFLIFGFKSSDKRIGSQVRPCEICGVPAAQVLFRRSTRFSLFFIPLFPVKPASYAVQCTNCGSVRRADRHALAAR